MPKRTKKVKAVIMFADHGELSIPHATSLSPTKSYSRDQPVAVIPLTVEAYDAMVEQMAFGIFMADPEPHWHRTHVRPYCQKHAIAALRAIGITRPKEGKQ